MGGPFRRTCDFDCEHKNLRQPFRLGRFLSTRDMILIILSLVADLIARYPFAAAARSPL